MKTEETAMSDLEEVLLHLRQEKDPGLLKRILERSEKIRQRVLTEHGTLDVAADLVREGRDE